MNSRNRPTILTSKIPPFMPLIGIAVGLPGGHLLRVAHAENPYALFAGLIIFAAFAGLIGYYIGAASEALRTIERDADDLAYRIGAKALTPFADHTTQRVDVTILRGIHDDGPTLTAHIITTKGDQ